MFAKTYGATTLGIDGRIIDVEVDVSPGAAGLWTGGASRYVGEGVEGASAYCDSQLRHVAAAGAACIYVQKKGLCYDRMRFDVIEGCVRDMTDSDTACILRYENVFEVQHMSSMFL